MFVEQARQDRPFSVNVEKYMLLFDDFLYSIHLAKNALGNGG